MSTTYHKALIEQSIQELRSAGLFNDTLASLALEDKAACQHVVRTLLGRDDIVIESVKSQYRLVSSASREVILDAYAKDKDGRIINIEIQRGDTLDHARRIRYYGAMLDCEALKKGSDFSELPDTYIIYISEKNLWDATDAACLAKIPNPNLAKPYIDGMHVILVTAAVDDGTEAARLMRYFRCADPADMTEGDLSCYIRTLKTEERGCAIMSDTIQELYELGQSEGRAEGKAEGIEEGMTMKGFEDIKSLMDSVAWTAQQAMDALKIPAEEQPQYLAML